MYKIIRKEVLNDVVELMEIHAPYVAKKCEPGQFIILRVGEDGERIPLTIADFDREKETITIIYQIVGYSTKELSNWNSTDLFPYISNLPPHIDISRDLTQPRNIRMPY